MALGFDKGPRSLHSRSYAACRSAGRFTKNPDLVRLPTGRLLFVYCDNDAHWSQETQVMTVVASDDEGVSWAKFAEVDRADLRKGDERLVTPRLSLLSDGRLVVSIDHDDFSHFHEDQSIGTDLYWSRDGGRNWTKAPRPNFPGFEPDRIIELPDGRLLTAAQIIRRETMRFTEVITHSIDDGETWEPIADIPGHEYCAICEGALVLLDGGREIALVARNQENSGLPSYVSFSSDGGYTWSDIQPLPFAIHRPYAKQLADGRVLVTGRHVNGIVGCVAWAGDLKKEAGRFEVGGPRKPSMVELTADALVMHGEKQMHCRYSLIPPESPRSEVFFEAKLKIDAPPDQPAAVMSIARLISNNWRSPNVVLWLGSNFISLDADGHDSQKSADLSTRRTISLHYRLGLLTVKVDGKPVIYQQILPESAILYDWFADAPQHRSLFGTALNPGTVYWQSVQYRVTNPAQPAYTFSWTPQAGTFPNDYQNRRLTQLHGNAPGEYHTLDLGYSSWLEMPDGSIQFVDYSSCGDAPGKSHIVGLRFRPEEIL